MNRPEENKIDGAGTGIKNLSTFLPMFGILFWKMNQGTNLKIIKTFLAIQIETCIENKGDIASIFQFECTLCLIE